MMIHAVDQNDLRPCVLQRLGSCQPSESTADDYNYGKMVAHILEEPRPAGFVGVAQTLSGVAVMPALEHDQMGLAAQAGEPAPHPAQLTRAPKPGRSVCRQRSPQPVCCGARDAHFAGHQVYRDPAHHLRETAFVPERTQEPGLQHRL